MKKILLSILTVGAVGGLVFAATNAFFSDTETSSGNILQAGAIDLLVDNESYRTDENGVLVASSGTSWDLRDLTVEKFFNFFDLKPGDWGEDTISLHVNNNPAYACAHVEVSENLDNDITEPESDDDTTPGVGDLGEQVEFFFWADDGDNVYEDEEQQLTQGPVSNIFGSGGATLALADSNGSVFDTLTLLPENDYHIGKAWCFGDLSVSPVAEDNTGPLVRSSGITCNGAPLDNSAQTDSLIGDISFYAVQARNHENGFSCSDVVWPAPVGLKVGSSLASYSAPTTCNETVETTESIQTAIGAVAPGGTVCVANSYDQSGDNVAIRISKDNVTVAALVQGIGLDVPVVLDNDGTKVTGFDGVIGTAESGAEQTAFYIDGDAENVEISFNSVTGGSGAAVLTETGGTNNGGLIRHNVLSGATQGVYLNPHTGLITIEYNDIDNNAAGIGGFNGAVVRYNEFDHTTPSSEAIGIDETFDDNNGVINFNNFLSDLRINTYDTAFSGVIDDTVNAENNFFGPNGGAAQVDETNGDVDFTPEAGAQYAHN